MMTAKMGERDSREEILKAFRCVEAVCEGGLERRLGLVCCLVCLYTQPCFFRCSAAANSVAVLGFNTSMKSDSTAARPPPPTAPPTAPQSV